MKKTTALFCILFISVYTFAQGQQKKFQLGFHFSPNLGWLKAESETIEGDGIKFGFSYGVIADFNIADNYAISTGINLLTMSGVVNYPDVQIVNATTGVQELGRTEADIQFNYIQIPISLKLKTNQIGYMKYFGQFGCGLGIAYDSKADIDFSYPGSTRTSSKEGVNYEDKTNFFRASLIVGLGAEYNISGNTSLLFGITYDKGFSNVFSEDGWHEDANGNAIAPEDKKIKAHSQAIVLNLGVLF